MSTAARSSFIIFLFRIMSGPHRGVMPILMVVVAAAIFSLVQSAALDPSCEEVGRKAKGRKYEGVVKVATWEECKARCKADDGCKFWAHYSSAAPLARYRNNCLMFEGDVTSWRRNPVVTTGSMECVLVELIDPADVIEDTSVEETVEIDECDATPPPCGQNGACTDGDGTFICECSEGFEGDNCELETDECHPNPCGNGGECTDGQSAFTCTCPEPFTGDSCQTEIVTTFKGNSNGASCVFPFHGYGKDFSECTDYKGDGYTWCSTTADYDTDHKWGMCSCIGGNSCCSDGVCGVNEGDCDKDGDCAGDLVCGSDNCVGDSFSWSDDCCESVIDPCAPNPCQNGGDCSLGACTCAAGFAGDNCEVALTVGPSTFDGNSDGATCVFPFLGYGSEYSECTAEHGSGYTWCSTTYNYEADGQWGRCGCIGGDSCCHDGICGENEGDCDKDHDCVDGLACGEDNCVGDSFQDTDDCCEDLGLTVGQATFKGNADGANCIFPFIGYGSEYMECTAEHGSGYTWCGTTSNYDRDSKWGYCGCIGRDDCCSDGNCGVNEGDCDKDSDCAEGLICGTDNCPPSDSFQGTDDCCEAVEAYTEVLTHSGNADGAACVFPFTYRKKDYEECTEEKGYMWCGTTSNYDRDHKWGKCSCVGDDSCCSDGNCGVNEGDCDKDTDCAGDLACGTNNCGGDTFQFTDDCCEDIGLTYGDATYAGNSKGAPCVFPFVGYKNTETACTGEKGYKWCSTTSNYDRDGKWGKCGTGLTYGGNSGGENCVFPFIGYGKTYDTCVKKSGYYWCATTASYDVDGKWAKCP